MHTQRLPGAYASASASSWSIDCTFILAKKSFSFFCDLILIHNILKLKSHLPLLGRRDYTTTTVQPSQLCVASRRGRVLVSIIGQIKSSVDWPCRSHAVYLQRKAACSYVPWAMRAPLMVFDRLPANPSLMWISVALLISQRWVKTRANY